MKRSTVAPYILALLMPLSGIAQELTPRAYWPAPKGTRVATIGYAFTEGDIVPDPSLPITGVDSEISSLSLGYLQTVDLFGRTANVILEVPYAEGDTVGTGNFGENIKREYKGIGDIAATVSVNLLGAPSMSREEFSQMRGNPGPIIGASLKIVAPTGKYDPDRIINVGANRWAAKAELGFMLPINSKWLFEFDVGGWMFSDNDDFLGYRREQQGIVALQAHLVHRFRPGFWGSLDANFYTGGRSTVGGRKLNDLQRDSKLGLTLVFPVAREHVLKLGYSHGSVNDKDEDFNVYLLAYSRLF